jgi:uncharacterized protein involved in cysteine biosynthesis
MCTAPCRVFTRVFRLDRVEVLRALLALDLALVGLRVRVVVFFMSHLRDWVDSLKGNTQAQVLGALDGVSAYLVVMISAMNRSRMDDGVRLHGKN